MALPAQVAEEVLSSSRVVRIFGTEQEEAKRYTHWLECVGGVRVHGA
jgi:hypothetical protein